MAESWITPAIKAKAVRTTWWKNPLKVFLVMPGTKADYVQVSLVLVNFGGGSKGNTPAGMRTSMKLPRS